jgi:hypothetical protein
MKHIEAFFPGLSAQGDPDFFCIGYLPLDGVLTTFIHFLFGFAQKKNAINPKKLLLMSIEWGI